MLQFPRHLHWYRMKSICSFQIVTVACRHRNGTEFRVCRPIVGLFPLFLFEMLHRLANTSRKMAAASGLIKPVTRALSTASPVSISVRFAPMNHLCASARPGMRSCEFYARFSSSIGGFIRELSAALHPERYFVQEKVFGTTIVDGKERDVRSFTLS